MVIDKGEEVVINKGEERDINNSEERVITKEEETVINMREKFINREETVISKGEEEEVAIQVDQSRMWFQHEVRNLGFSFDVIAFMTSALTVWI